MAVAQMLSLALVVCMSLVPASALRRMYAPDQDIHGDARHGAPLKISDVRKQKGVAAAQDAAKVTGLGNFTSYAGFYQVAENTDNNLFVWYFPSQDGNKNAPLLIWLQGGPGGASTFGLFSEIGPFSVNENLELEARDTTWNKEYSLLFIDNPVGAGYSYTGTGTGYAKNSRDDVARDLYACMNEFYATFPDQLANDLYITGESYAGHYIPAFGAYLHNKISSGESKINFKGVSIGDGWTWPVIQMQATPQMMYDLGLADQSQVDVLQAYADDVTDYISLGNYSAAFDIWDLMLNGDIYPYPTYFYNLTGSLDYDNFMRSMPPASFDYYSKYITQDSVRQAIHVGNATLQSGHTCEMNLINDVMDEYASELQVLLDSYKVLLYNGQLDLIVGAPLTERYLPHLKWTGAGAYAVADRKVWKVDAKDVEVAGYVKQAQGFTYVVVRGAGHIAPYDQGRSVKNMLDHFVAETPF